MVFRRYLFSNGHGALSSRSAKRKSQHAKWKKLFENHRYNIVYSHWTSFPLCISCENHKTWKIKKNPSRFYVLQHWLTPISSWKKTLKMFTQRKSVHYPPIHPPIYPTTFLPSHSYPLTPYLRKVTCRSVIARCNIFRHTDVKGERERMWRRRRNSVWFP